MSVPPNPDNASMDHNPYTPSETAENSVDVTWVKVIRIEAPKFPAGPTRCSYFTFDSFAQMLTTELVEACKPFGYQAILFSQKDHQQNADASISCYVHDISEYHITYWQRIFKLFLPIIGYSYFPASFTLSGTIKSPYHPAVTIHSHRKFDPGGFGEFARMKNGIREEAIRLITIAARELDDSQSIKRRSRFWQYVLLVPFAAGLLAALFAFLALRFLAAVSEQTSHENQLSALFFAAFIVALIPPLTLTFAPEWVYADRRAGFAFRMISSTRSLTLRAFIFISGFIFAFLVAIVSAIIAGNLR